MNRREALLGAAALAACGPAASVPAPTPFPMRRGVNLGNALEAPNESDWGYRIEPEHLRAIAHAGFDGVRLPVRWDAHADERGAIAAPLLLRVAAILDACFALGLKVQLDCHHYEMLIANPAAQRQRYLNIWRAIAEDQHEAPPLLMFEPLNEPNGAVRGEVLRDLQRDVLAVIRDSNPGRVVVFGPGQWQNIDALADWRPPEGEHVAASVHYYEPHAFTHQNAEWLGADAPHFGRAWGTVADCAQVRRQIDAAADWSRRNGYSLQLGEFGVNRAVPIAQRAPWTRAVREACEANGVGWCVWDFAGAFPIWDRERRAFIPEMREALITRR